MDDYLGNFFVFLENKNLLENTIVIILSDHGEIMYRHPGFFDHHGLYEGNIHCPLIIYVPEAQPRRVNNLIQHVDIAPTILELLGILVPSTMEGKSAAAHIKGESEEALSSTLYTQECTYQAKWGIRTSKYKLILPLLYVIITFSNCLFLKTFGVTKSGSVPLSSVRGVRRRKIRLFPA